MMRFLKAIQVILLVGICSLTVSTAYGDFNWPFGPPPDSKPPGDGVGPQPDKPPKDPCKTSGSIIGCEPQTLGEVIDVTGTPLSLHYQSDRVFGRHDTDKLKNRLSGATLPPNLQRIHLEIAFAGQAFKKNFAPLPNLVDTFAWDGKDAYGRPVRGLQPVKVRIGYEYIAQYYATGDSFAASFNRFGSFPIGIGGGSGGGGGGGSAVAFSFLPARTTTPPIILWRDYETSLGSLDSPDLGGWSLNVHHAYDAGGRSLYLGNGDQRSATAMNVVIATVAGTGDPHFAGDGGPATQAKLSPTGGIAVGSDGSLYISDRNNERIRRVGPDGVITTVAGTGGVGFTGDGGPATQATLHTPFDVAVGSDGSLYIADTNNHRIRRVGTDGIITTVAGTGVAGFAGDGGSATQAKLNQPLGVAVGSDGSLYITDINNQRIRRVGTDGIITTVAGSANVGFATGDGGPATQAGLNNPMGVAVGTDGSLYISDQSQRIRRVGSDGIITTVAGTGVTGFAGDGGPATQAQINNIQGGIAVGPDGSLYIADANNNRIRQIRPSLPGFSVSDIVIAAEDGSEVYVFTGTGRHQRTLDAQTGAVRFQFTYNTAGHLATIIDGDDNVTTIERDGIGSPSAIAAPFGQLTALAVQGDGYLSRVTNPAGETVQLTYNSGEAEGLLATLTDPRGNVHHYLYDALGRLMRDENPAGGVKTLVRNDITDDHYTVAVTTALGLVTTYEVDELSTGDTRRVRIDASGARAESFIHTDGSRKTTFADGTVVNRLQGPDPRWSMQTPVSKSLITTKGGLTSTLTTDRQAVLADANNPLSLIRLTDTVTLNGRILKRVFDKATQTTTRTTPAGRISTAVTDSLGRVTQAQVSGFLTANSAYDAKGRLSRVGQGSGADERVVDFAYNPQGYLASVTDPLGRSLGLEYDAAGRITRQTQPDGRIILYGYDANGNLASLTPPGRPGHIFHYTPVNLTQDYQPPAVSVSNNTVYDYDLDKHLTKITRPDSQTLSFTYDSAGRRSILDTPGGAISYAYDPVTGKLTGITDTAGGKLNFSYSSGLLTQTTLTGAVSGSVGRTYDNDFRITSLNVNGANAIAFQYDADSLLTQAGSLNLGRNAQNGVLTGTTLGNVTDSLSYDGFGAVTDYAVKVNATSVLSTQFTRDKLGRITRKVETVGGVVHTYDYGYDLAGRLEQVRQDSLVTASYTYDSNGNRLTGPNLLNTATYDDQDRLLSYNGSTYDYTANGELKTKTTGAAITSYDYDVLGNLKHVTLPGGASIDYVIDGQNRRIGKKVGGTLVQGFLYEDDLKPIAELDGTNTVVSRFVYATGVNVPDTMIKGGQTYRVITDHLGSPRLVVNVADGTVAQKLSYDEFGNLLIDTNPGFQPFGYAGGIYDRDTRLVRFGARDYDADTGRWMAKDPIRFAAGDTNIYSYVVGEPINRTDPSGLQQVGPKAAPENLCYYEHSLGDGAINLLECGACLGNLWKASKGDSDSMSQIWVNGGSCVQCLSPPSGSWRPCPDPEPPPPPDNGGTCDEPPEEDDTLDGPQYTPERPNQSPGPNQTPKGPNQSGG